MDNYLVSICIPTYNAANYIVDSVNSILNQSYTNFEIIIVNDGSTDNTKTILNSYSDRRLKIIHTQNKGQSAAANLAYQNSKGEYIKFFDADDILSPHFIENQVLVLKNNPNAIASAGWGRFKKNDLTTFKLNKEPVWRDMLPIDWIVESLESNTNMMQCGLWLIPRNIIKKAGTWNPKLSLINDFDFFTRVLLASDMVLFTKDAILYYRSEIENSLSSQKSSKSLKSAFLSITSVVDNILSFENSERTRKICRNVLQHWKYQFYPKEMELYSKTKELILPLGKADFKFPAGGKTKILTNLIGWKLTKKLKYLFK